MHRRLFMICSGQTSTGRVIHLQKITRLVTKTYEKTIVYTEDTPTIVLQKNQSLSSAIERDIISKAKSSRFVLKVLDFIRQEFKKGRFLLANLCEGDTALFLGIYQPLAVLVAKLRGASTVLFGGGFDIARRSFGIAHIDTLYFYMRWTFEINMLRHFEKIIVESPAVVDAYGLGRFGDRIITNGHLFVDDRFFAEGEQSKRDIDVTYIGALSREKGIVEFLEALRIVLERRSIRALIVGDGVLLGRVKAFLGKQDFRDFVEHRRRVSYESMPNILRRTKLIVVPSYSEGLPNVLLEAMACRTPALATAVGAMPDIIRDYQTGFLLRSNHPEDIAEKVTELLGNPELLKRVGENAYRYVNRNFTYKRTWGSWQKIFNGVRPK